MGLANIRSGMLRLKLTSADLPATLSRLTGLLVQIRDIKYVDEMCCTFCLPGSDLNSVTESCEKCGEKLEIIGHFGLYWKVKGLLCRPVLVTGMVMILFLTLWLPTRVCFIRVEGNQKVPTRLIIEKAALCGLKTGASTRHIRSEQIKNGLLQHLEQLQWIGVNIDGCVATISVRERTEVPVKAENNAFCSLVAVRDGVICSVTAQKGSPLCKIGDAVRGGQLLISAYTDCGLHIQATGAAGEIYAYTQRDLQVVTPSNVFKKGPHRGQNEKFSLIIGKKRINFYKGSGISPTGCDKITKEYHLTLPGGFTLPISVVRTTLVAHDTAVKAYDAKTLQQTASTFAGKYLLSQMIAGTVMNKTEFTSRQPEVFVLSGVYDCCEMIAISRQEEITGFYE